MLAYVVRIKAVMLYCNRTLISVGHVYYFVTTGDPKFYGHYINKCYNF